MARSRGKNDYERWINNYEVASSWIAKRDVERAVDANGGLVRIENFLPEFVAEGILATVSAVPEERWNDTSASTDYRHNNISHSFSSVKHAKGLDAVVRLFSLVRPGSLNAFSAARYCKQDHIAPHDDRAYTQVQLDNGRVITTSRTLAIIYYLTRDWREEYGGVLVDLEDPSASPGEGRKYVPLWNSVVAFRVPRYHAVTPLTSSRPRYSIFGWFLEPGKLYNLYRGEKDEQKQAFANGQDRALGRQRSGPEGPAANNGPADPAAAAVLARDGGAEAGPPDVEADADGEAGPQSGGGGARGGRWREQRRQPEAGRRDPARKRTRDGGGDGEVAAGPSDRGGSAQRQLGRGGDDRQTEGRGRRVRHAGQEQPPLEPCGHRGAAPRGAAGGGGGGGAVGSQLGGVPAGGQEASGMGQPGAKVGGLVRLPGRWQGRRKHVCVG